MKKLILLLVAIALAAIGIVRVELFAQPRPADSKTGNNAALNDQRAGKHKAMIEAAKAAYAGIIENHNLGRAISNNEVYVWSSNIRSSELRAAGSPQEVAKANQDHLQRMRDLHAKVVSLGREGFAGGEVHKQAATQYYVAEAELVLLEAQNNEKSR
jgi:hypothetical protein